MVLTDAAVDTSVGTLEAEPAEVAPLVIGAGAFAVELLGCPTEEVELTAVVDVVTSPAVELIDSEPVLAVADAGTVAAMVLLEEPNVEEELSGPVLLTADVEVTPDVIAGLGEIGVADAALLVSELLATTAVAVEVDVDDDEDESEAEAEGDCVTVDSVNAAVEPLTEDAGTAEVEASELVEATVAESVTMDADDAELDTSELVAAASVLAAERTLLVCAVTIEDETTMTVPVEELVVVGRDADPDVVVVELDDAEIETLLSVAESSPEVAEAIALDTSEATDDARAFVAVADVRVERMLDSTEATDDKTEVTSVD